MDNTNITLLIAKNELIVNDRTVLDGNFGGVDGFRAIEFVTYADSNVALGLKVCVPEECSDARILLEKDGLYYYHKLYVPNIQYVANMNSETKVGEIFVNKEVDDEGNTVYKYYQVKTEPTGADLTQFSVELKNVAEVYEAAVKAWTGTPNQTLYIAKKPVFCIWHMRRCLADLQQELLLNDYKNECNTNKTLRNKRDFLFGAAYVLDYLSSTCNYKEAQRVLDNLSSCGFLCGDSTVNTKTCCCGNTL